MGDSVLPTEVVDGAVRETLRCRADAGQNGDVDAVVQRARSSAGCCALKAPVAARRPQSARTKLVDGCCGWQISKSAATAVRQMVVSALVKMPVRLPMPAACEHSEGAK